MPRHARLASLLLLCGGGGLLLAACGASSSPSTSTAAFSPEAMVKFARCLREHGIEASTPTGSQGGIALKITGSGSRQVFEAAQNACKRFRPPPPHFTPAEQAAHQEAALKFAKCMRSHGIDVPDPTSSGGQVKIGLGRGPGGPNPSSATFQAAQKACQGYFPGPKGPKPFPGPVGAGPPGKGGGGGNAAVQVVR